MVDTDKSAATPLSADDLARLEHLLDAKVVAALRSLEEDSEQQQESVTLVVFSGDMDRLMAAFIIATGAAAMGMRVSLFFTFWGLTALRKKTLLRGKSLLEKLVSVFLPRGPHSVGPSRMGFFGLGRLFFGRLMKRKNVQSLPELVELARELDVRLIACQMSMDVMGIQHEELIDGVELGGVGTYLGEASDAKLSLFV